MELKPCPFCGGEAQLRVFGWIDHKEHYGIRCLRCLAQTMDYHETEAEAIEAWNTRHERTVIMETCRNLSEWHDADEFICSKCGIILNGYAEVYYNEDGSTGVYEFACEYCPNCGAKVVE